MRLIDADELKHRMEAVEMFGLKGLMKVARGMVIMSPTVDAEPVKHGHWVNKGFEPLRCSVCGITVDAINGIPWAIKSFNYCPNCGAKMDERREDGKID